LGGAANVAHNIMKLDGRVDLAGVVGRDEPGKWVAERLSSLGISPDGLLVLDGRLTTIKTRVIAHNQQVVRFDRESKDRLSPRAQSMLKTRIGERLDPKKTVVVSDYGKGAVNRSLLKFLRDRKRETGMKVCIDPKSRNFSVYKGFTLVTPNQSEAEQASQVDIADGRDLRKAGSKILGVVNSEALLITRGESGMTLFWADGRVSEIPTMAREVYDVTGAGDTVLACLALSLSVGASFLESAILANLAAGVVVGKMGTATVNREELLDSLKEVLPYLENNDR
jgi:D-beta-D-heptose 7-phosphate kinase/D-beta-D-heptose 1-phosphate adenosyltransferase